MKDYSSLEKKTGIHFNDEDLLETVFIHKSYLNETKGKRANNERLEFLGDAVLELVVTEYLYTQFPNPEGELTNWRSALVKGQNLAKIADELNLGKYLYLSRGEEKSGGRKKDYILANTLEALIGGIYLDQNYERARQFILKNVITKLDDILRNKLHIDSKSLFQEKSQEKFGITPGYRLIDVEGPDHAKQFTMGVYLGKELVAQGKGKSKQAAEQEAAQKALKKKKMAYIKHILQ